MLINIPILSLVMGLFCFCCTTLGASVVFFCKNLSSKLISFVLAFSGGIMIASSFFSLILPALEYCENNVFKESFFVIGGFLLGGMFLIFSSRLCEKVAIKKNISINKRNLLLVSSITLHNIPEGIAVGIAFGCVMVSGDQTLLTSAIMLAVGIGVQNIPEGLGVALALKGGGMKNKKAFFMGAMSGIVEPVFAVIACLCSMQIAVVFPLVLSFAGSVMLIVSLVEILPEAVRLQKNISVIALILGFCLMAFLDVLL